MNGVADYVGGSFLAFGASSHSRSQSRLSTVNNQTAIIASGAITILWHVEFLTYVILDVDTMMSTPTIPLF